MQKEVVTKMVQSYNKISISPKETMKKQQWAKTYSLYNVIKFLQNCPDSKLYKSYYNSLHCAHVKLLTMDEKTEKMKITSTYCKNRWCYVCNRIRTAVNISHYLPQINEFANPFFVTLTLPTCPAEDLKERIEHILKMWRNIYKRSFNGKRLKEVAEKDINLNGVRSIECTLRPNGMYHIHMHLIVDNWYNAEWVVKQWLKLHPEAYGGAQDIRKIYVKTEAEPLNIGGLMEVFKYALKMSVNAKKNEDYERMNLVFEAFKGKRLFSAFGNVKALRLDEKDEDELMDIVAQEAGEELEARFGNETRSFIWQPDLYDWIDKKTGEMLIGEPIPDRIHGIVKSVEELIQSGKLPKTRDEAKIQFAK
jgi:hypothetical protein